MNDGAFSGRFRRNTPQGGNAAPEMPPLGPMPTGPPSPGAPPMSEPIPITPPAVEADPPPPDAEHPLGPTGRPIGRPFNGELALARYSPDGALFAAPTVPPGNGPGIIAISVRDARSGDQVANLDASIAVMDADQLARARRAYQLLDALGFWLPFAWMVAVLLTLVVARRKVAATAKLAIGSLVALGLLALGLTVARTRLTEDLPERAVARQVWDVVTARLWHQLELAAVVLAVIALATAVVAVLRDRRAVTP